MIVLSLQQLETICNDTEITSKCSNCTLFALQKDLEKVEGNYYKDYPLSYNGSLGTIALSLSLNCSDKMLSELPQIPPQTWHLNVSLNKITSLAPLTSPHYKYLQGLDADYNQIDINTLKDAPLLKNYARLSLRFNHFNLVVQRERDLNNAQNLTPKVTSNSNLTLPDILKSFTINDKSARNLQQSI